MTLENELKHLVGKKVVKVVINSIRFEDGTEIELHPYETYIERTEEDHQIK